MINRMKSFYIFVSLLVFELMKMMKNVPLNLLPIVESSRHIRWNIYNP